MSRIRMGRGLYCKALRSLLLALVLLSLVGDGGCADNHGQSPVPGSPSGNDGGGESKKKTGIRKYMEDRGLSVKDLPAALILYETLSMTFMLSTLGFVLVLQPTKRGFLSPLKHILGQGEGNIIDRLSEKFQQAQLKARDKYAWLSRTLKVDAVQLATAYAECACIRIALKPFLVPMKLFLVWKILASYKAWREDRSRGR